MLRPSQRSLPLKKQTPPLSALTGRQVTENLTIAIQLVADANAACDNTKWLFGEMPNSNSCDEFSPKKLLSSEPGGFENLAPSTLAFTLGLLSRDDCFLSHSITSCCRGPLTKEAHEFAQVKAACKFMESIAFHCVFVPSCARSLRREGLPFHKFPIGATGGNITHLSDHTRLGKKHIHIIHIRRPHMPTFTIVR